jgi:hypothetical protein
MRSARCTSGLTISGAVRSLGHVLADVGVVELLLLLGVARLDLPFLVEDEDAREGVDGELVLPKLLRLIEDDVGALGRLILQLVVEELFRLGLLVFQGVVLINEVDGDGDEVVPILLLQLEQARHLLFAGDTRVLPEIDDDHLALVVLDDLLQVVVLEGLHLDLLLGEGRHGHEQRQQRRQAGPAGHSHHRSLHRKGADGRRGLCAHGSHGAGRGKGRFGARSR